MQELKIALACILVMFAGVAMWLLWSILPFLVFGICGVSVLCGGVAATKFLSRQTSEIASHWLEVADKKLAIDERKQAMYLRAVESNLVTFPSNHVAAMRSMSGLNVQYVPLSRIEKSIESSAVDAQLSIAGPLPSALELLSQSRDGQVCLGIGEGGPVWQEWRKVKAVLILGLQGGGKTSTAIWLISQVLLQGGRLAVIDKHARSEDDSMYQAIRPFETVFDVPIGDVPAAALRVVKHARKVLDARLSGAKCSYPLLLVVDEFSAIMRQMGTDGSWSEVAEKLSALIEDFNFEGRKHKCYAICIGQASNASRTGGSEVRDTFNTCIVHRMKEKQASMLSMTEEKKQIAQLQTGECFVDIEGMDTFMMKVPYANNALIDYVARSINHSDGVQGAFLAGSNNDLSGGIQYDVNGPENLSERVQRLREIGLGKEKIILELWGARKGGSEKYRQAEREYEEIVSSLA